jgi:hypothetical protein
VRDTTIAQAEFMIVLLPPEMTPPPDPERDEQRRLLASALGVLAATNGATKEDE